MSWDGNLTQQVEREFRDAKRLKGAHEPAEREPVVVGPRVEVVELIRRRRVVGPRRAS